MRRFRGHSLPLDNGDAGTAARGAVPLGGVLSYLKSFSGTPALTPGFVECNGQTLTDPGSAFATVPNLNASGGGSQRFLRGSTSSGTTGGSDTYTPAGTLGTPTTLVDVQGTVSVKAASSTHTHTFTGTNVTLLPSYYEVVWIMRIK